MSLFLKISLLLAVFAGQNFFGPWAQHTQSLCAGLFQAGHYPQWRSAVLCGTSLPLTAWNQNLKNWGLFHLIVVSGAHLVFLELLLRPTLLVFPLSWRKKLLVVFLVAFCFLSGLQPPLVRAFIHRLPLKSQSERLLFSGLFSLMFFRAFSLSLALSWSATLLVTWPQTGKRHPCLTSLFVLAGLYPLLLPLGAPQGLSGLLQPPFSFVFGLLVFPASLLSLFPPLVGLSDFCWDFFLKMTAWDQWFHLQTFKTQISLSTPLYVALLQFLFWRAEVRTQRKRYWSAS
jgi:hypothetical protein